MQTNNLCRKKQSHKSDQKVLEQQSLKQLEFNKLSNKKKIQRGLEITRHLIDSQIEEDIVISDDLSSFTLLSTEVSPFPTESRKIMKYIQTDMLQNFMNKKNFVQVDNYCVVFANVEDLSYHNFENILNLDHLFNTVKFQIETKKLIGKQVQIFNMTGATEDLLSLDRLNYYTIPLNNSQRGGRRLIFHSNQLSFSLTKMIEESEFFDKKNFSHVNNVFRLNNFAPGDKKFKSHYDTPFADNSKDLYSKYTMIIYLTGNSVIKKSQPPLRIKNIVFDQIKENDCIIFDQKYEHEGNAYIDKNKIFIRTELIYKINNMDYDQKIARMFNMACYMTKETGQQQYSADLFNSCVKMRYRVKEEVKRVYLMKQNLEILYITDGNYYWFSQDIELKSIAMLIVLDYFNGKIYDLKNVKIKSKTLPRKNSQDEEESDESIFNFIEMCTFRHEIINKDKIQNYQNTDDFIPDSLCEDFTVFECSCDAGGSSETAQSYFSFEKSRAVEDLNSMLDENTVLIFDDMIKINYKNIKIQMDDKNGNNLQSGKIVLTDFFINTQKKINFASYQCECKCKYQYEEEDIVSFETQKVHTFCLPDISFQKFSNGIKLSIDMFNNGFVHNSTNIFNQPNTDECLAEENKERRKSKKRRSKKQSDNDDNLDDDSVDDENVEDDNVDDDIYYIVEDDVEDYEEDDQEEDDQEEDDEEYYEEEEEGDDDKEINNDDKICQVFNKGGINSKEKKQNNKIKAEFQESSHKNMRLANK